jgi:membrane peptidoglycan carboxypeptidase
MAVNRYYSEQDLPGHSKVNLATGGSSGMQAGSTFKPFILTAALQQGIPLGLSIYSPNRYTSDVFKDNKNGRHRPVLAEQRGRLGDRRRHLRPAQRDLELRQHLLRAARGADRHRAAGRPGRGHGGQRFENGSPSAPLQRVPSFVLGVNDVSPLAMAGAYATFPAHGRSARPRRSSRCSTARASRSSSPRSPAGR